MFIRNCKLEFIGLILIVLLCSAPCANAIDLPTVPQTQDMHTDKPNLLTRVFEVKVEVSNQSLQPARNLHVQIPLISVNSPYQQTAEEKFNYKYDNLSADKLGNRTAEFFIDSLDGGQSKTIVIDYILKIMPDGYLPQNNNLTVSESYLQAGKKIESDHPEIIAAAQKINIHAANDMDKLNNIAAFVNSHMKYNLNAPGSNQGALSALHTGEGVCEDFAALFTALCRASDIPARLVNGYADPKLTGESWNKDSIPLISLEGFRHSWAEVYLKEKGWLAVDPTFNIFPQPDSISVLTHSHIAQNYGDSPLRLTYQGAKPAVKWDNFLVNN